MNNENLIVPDWPAPEHVKAYVTTRFGGVSDAPYDSFNLSDNVGDNAQQVIANRQQLQQQLKLPTASSDQVWLRQVHGLDVIKLPNTDCSPEGDAVYTRQQGQVCAVLTADCLPVLVCDKQGKQVAAIHAGWRGLLDGIIEQTIAQMDNVDGQLMAWLGPAIGPTHLQVGEEVYADFVAHTAEATQGFVRDPRDNQCWLMDIFLLGKQRLRSCGVTAIYGGGVCTYTEKDRFYSYRREEVTGRMASLVWME